MVSCYGSGSHGYDNFTSATAQERGGRGPLLASPEQIKTIPPLKIYSDEKREFLNIPNNIM